MYMLSIARAIKKMSVNEPRDFILENYFKRIRFVKEESYYSMLRLKENIFAVAFNHINRKKCDLVMLKNTIHHF